MLQGRGAGVWLTRVAGLIVVGVVTFTEPQNVPGGTTTQLVAFIGLCLAEVVWAFGEAERLPGSSARYLRPVAATLMVATSCLGATAGGGGSFMIIFGAGTMMTLATDLSLNATLIAGALGVLVIEIGCVVFDQGVGSYIGLPLLLVVGTLFGRNRAEYRLRVEQSTALLVQQQQLQAEQRRADVLDERTRLAREIHDVLAHSLGALGIQIQAARALITDRGDTEAALEALAAAQRMASEGLVETRRAVHALRTETLPLHEELARAAAEHAERQHVVVHCDIEGEPGAVRPEATVALLRAAQEALVNAAKHAPGAEVEVHLAYRPGALRLVIANDLARGAVAEGTPRMQTIDGGFGLTGMRERLKQLGGTLEAGPVGDRWIVAADLPLEAA